MATKQKPKLTKTIKFRVSEFEENQIKRLAETFAEGNVSLWCIHGTLNAPRKKINLDDIKKSSRRNIKKGN